MHSLTHSRGTLKFTEVLFLPDAMTCLTMKMLLDVQPACDPTNDWALPHPAAAEPLHQALQPRRVP